MARTITYPTAEHRDDAVGLDEVGRGCIAGPVVAAAIIIPKSILKDIAVRDSKKLSEKARWLLSKELTSQATAWGIGVASSAEVDHHNILKATMIAMQRALHQCWVQPAFALVDGRDDPGLKIPTRTVIAGDATVSLIAAAGIIAKVYRDHLMGVYDKQYPHYHFAQHKGYGTRLHLACLDEQGVSPIHRLSFKPVADIADKKVEVDCL
ncbi:MAG: ribonuclease HII [Pseudomonadota bacterium]|nr:ribonuclease HII [Pseudomonadota bacterium]